MIAIKSSANPKGLTPQCVLLLMVANEVHKELGLDLFITSLNDSKHSENSYHYSGNAFDSRIRSTTWPSHLYPDRDQCEKIIQMAASRLNDAFDIVLESDHIHWEYNARTQ